MSAKGLHPLPSITPYQFAVHGAWLTLCKELVAGPSTTFGCTAWWLRQLISGDVTLETHLEEGLKLCPHAIGVGLPPPVLGHVVRVPSGVLHDCFWVEDGVLFRDEGAADGQNGAKDGGVPKQVPVKKLQTKLQTKMSARTDSAAARLSCFLFCRVLLGRT